MTTFNADLRIPPTEQFGPKLNSRTVALLHPDMYQTNQDIGRTRIAQREVDRIAWLPDNNLSNLYLKDINTLDQNGNLTPRPTTVPQKVGPEQPLGVAGEDPSLFAQFVDTVNNARIAYLDTTYGHTASGTTNIPAPGTEGTSETVSQILYHT
jgi:hypothetical protein